MLELLHGAVRTDRCFLEVELLYRQRLPTIRKPTEYAGQRERDEARILTVTEGPPIRIFDRIEDLLEITRARQLAEVLEAEQLRARRRYERAEAGGRHTGHAA